LLFTEHNKSKDSLHPIIYTYKFTHFTIKNKLFLKFLTKRKTILPHFFIPSSLLYLMPQCFRLRNKQHENIIKRQGEYAVGIVVFRCN